MLICNTLGVSAIYYREFTTELYTLLKGPTALQVLTQAQSVRADYIYVKCYKITAAVLDRAYYRTTLQIVFYGLTYKTL